MAFTNFNGKRLHHESAGEGTAIVLIHGFTNYGLSWCQQVPALVHAGYEVILPDLYGHGLSQACDHVTPVSELAEGVLAILDDRNIDFAHFCGLSLGGMVAQQIALDHSARARSLVIADSFAAEPGIAAAIATWVDLFRQPGGPRKRLKTTWPNLVSEPFTQTEAGQAAFATWERILDGVTGDSLINVARGMALFDTRERLKEITQPTLVIYGGSDKLVNPERSHDLARGIPGASLRGIPGAGHISCLDSPHTFNELLLEFLESHKAN